MNADCLKTGVDVLCRGISYHGDLYSDQLNLYLVAASLNGADFKDNDLLVHDLLFIGGDVSDIRAGRSVTMCIQGIIDNSDKFGKYLDTLTGDSGAMYPNAVIKNNMVSKVELEENDRKYEFVSLDEAQYPDKLDNDLARAVQEVQDDTFSTRHFWFCGTSCRKRIKLIHALLRKAQQEPDNAWRYRCALDEIRKAANVASTDADGHTQSDNQ